MSPLPGTSQYFDDPQRPQFAPDGVTGLKCDTSGPVPVILVPQPSDDPNDPLNWPLWKRDLITIILSLTAIFVTSLGSILAANTVTLSLWFEMEFTKIAELTGYFLLGTGVSSIFWVPSSRILGKRHTFVFGTLIVIVSSAWGGASGRSYTSMLWARIFQGVGTAPFEALVNAAVGDMYCVHVSRVRLLVRPGFVANRADRGQHRGLRMAFTNLAVFGGAFFTPVVVGRITHALGWWWTFYLVAIFCAVSLPLIYFLCPETCYPRDAALSLDMVAQVHRFDDDGPGPLRSVRSADLEAKPKQSGVPTSNATPQNGAVSPRTPGPVPPRNSLRHDVALFNGRKTDENFLKLLLRPFPLFLQPAFLWACFVQGTLIGWTVFIGVIMGSFFLGYPLWWDEVRSGYAYVSAFIGAVIGFIVAGALADWSARALTRLNKGVYEPEFRLVLILPQLVLGCVGLYGFGITADGLLKNKYHYTVPLTFFALVVAAMVIGAVASSLYLVDAYRKPPPPWPFWGRVDLQMLTPTLCSQATWSSRASPPRSSSRTCSASR